MRTHLSLNVKNVAESVAFYQKVFGATPQKHNSTYAKFDLQEPPLNFAMQSGGELSRVSHLGIEVDSDDEMVRWQKRLTELGLVSLIETDTSCCFARQDKIWFSDPDGNRWEVFYIREQLPVTETMEQCDFCR
ncbi:MAG TPA: ArsI/CadI family heavy metal resistance metalloenzyme [Nitrospiria bacterium]|nr:ArsI/CadI family heavy metal resistance metalloenzyme [Nitrospiria bacterium]